jgi:Mn-dependent DtxR family transcriptional regulator
VATVGVSRRDVLEATAAASEAWSGRETTVSSIAAGLDAEESVVESHLDRLAACELVAVGPGGCVRITVTGQELLELDVDGPIVVETPDPDPDE